MVQFETAFAWVAALHIVLDACGIVEIAVAMARETRIAVGREPLSLVVCLAAPGALAQFADIIGAADSAHVTTHIRAILAYAAIVCIAERFLFGSRTFNGRIRIAAGAVDECKGQGQQNTD